MREDSTPSMVRTNSTFFLHAQIESAYTKKSSNLIKIGVKLFLKCLHLPQLICFIIFIFIHLVDAFMHSVLQISSQIYPQILHGKHLQIPSGPSNHLSYLLSLLLTQFLSLSLVISNSVFRWRPMLKSRKLTHFSLYTVWHKLSSDNAVRVEKKHFSLFSEGFAQLAVVLSGIWSRGIYLEREECQEEL